MATAKKKQSMATKAKETEAKTPAKEEEAGFTCASKKRPPVVKYLCEGGMTDEQIATKAMADLEADGVTRKITPRFVANNRKAINEGRRDEMIEALGFKEPEGLIEELVDVDGEIMPASKAPAKEKPAKEKKKKAVEEKLEKHGVEIKKDVEDDDVPAPSRKKKKKPASA